MTRWFACAVSLSWLRWEAVAGRSRRTKCTVPLGGGREKGKREKRERENGAWVISIRHDRSGTPSKAYLSCIFSRPFHLVGGKRTDVRSGNVSCYSFWSRHLVGEIQIKSIFHPDALGIMFVCTVGLFAFCPEGGQLGIRLWCTAEMHYTCKKIAEPVFTSPYRLTPCWVERREV